VVLNDNQMSISANVGAVSRLLRTRGARGFFEGMGFTYLGPVDGHDLPALLAALKQARQSFKPILVHVHTLKGRGFPPAEGDAQTRGHAMGPYEWRAGKLVRSRGGQRTFSDALADALSERMARDEKVVVVTPAMLEGSALVELQRRFPDRVFDVGIAEQHAVTFSAGLAAAGLRPVCCIYSTFLQRAVDQVIHDVCLPGLPVVFAVDRAGLVGADGATHQGAYDVALLRSIPGLRIVAPVVGEDMAPMLEDALQAAGPTCLRFPRGTLPVIAGIPPAGAGARWLRRLQGARGTFVTLGPLGLCALEARGDWAVLDAHLAEPLDEGALEDAAQGGLLVVAEEGTTRGGLGSAVLEFLARRGLAPRVQLLGLPDAFLPHGDARVQRAELGLDAEGLRRASEQLEALR